MTEEKKSEVCGIVMPISSIDGCSEGHWTDVLDILSEAVTDAGFEPNLVSNADDVGIIHKRIIQNLYNNPIVVCDVSGKNPNVMFELGLRLAFDKPTIIVKDDKTTYSFDTSAIEHLEYPRDLRFSKIVDFKKVLTEKIKSTLSKSKSDPNYTTFLKHFGTFHVAKLESAEVSSDQIILDELQELRKAINMQRSRDRRLVRERELGLDKSALDVGPHMLHSIKDAVSSMKIRGRAQIRERKEEISERVLETFDAPRYFDRKRDYDHYFDEVFKSLYG